MFVTFAVIIITAGRAGHSARKKIGSLARPMIFCERDNESMFKKKILAIAMAAVTALSMTTAFAAFNWTTPVVNRTGKATVEVIPYVKTSNGSGGFAWKTSDCAAAVSSENIYFAVKLTVAANPDKDWLANASVELEAAGLTSAWDNSAYDAIPLTSVDEDSTRQAVYYLTRESAAGNALAAVPWTKLSSSFTLADDVEQQDSLCIFTAPVQNSNKAKVCATLTSSFGTGSSAFTAGAVGEYYVTYGNNALSIYPDAATAAADSARFLVRYTINASTERVTSVTNQAGSTAPDDYDTIKAFFGIDVGTRVNQSLVNANFGWSDEVQSCFKWGSSTAIVTPDCDVSIPKTGDASVMAYAAIAAVSALGVMVKRK